MFGTYLRAIVTLIVGALVLWTFAFVIEPITDAVDDVAGDGGSELTIYFDQTAEFLPLIFLLSLGILVSAAAIYQRRAGAVR